MSCFSRPPVGSRGDPPKRSVRERAGTRSGAVALKLLQGTLASLRCRELIEVGRHDEARLSLLNLRAALKELEGMTLDEESAGEMLKLRVRSTKFGVMLGFEGSMTRSPSNRPPAPDTEAPPAGFSSFATGGPPEPEERE